MPIVCIYRNAMLQFHIPQQAHTNEKNPLLITAGSSQKGLERREEEKRIYGKATAHGFRNLSVYKIQDRFERAVSEMKIKFDKFVNSSIFPKKR